jgi:hypothetical protein
LLLLFLFFYFGWTDLLKKKEMSLICHVSCSLSQKKVKDLEDIHWFLQFFLWINNTRRGHSKKCRPIKIKQDIPKEVWGEIHCVFLFILEERFFVNISFILFLWTNVERDEDRRKHNKKYNKMTKNQDESKKNSHINNKNPNVVR